MSNLLSSIVFIHVVRFNTIEEQMFVPSPIKVIKIGDEAK